MMKYIMDGIVKGCFLLFTKNAKRVYFESA